MSKNYKGLVVAVLLVVACVFTVGCAKQDQTTNTVETNIVAEEEKTVTAELVINDGSQEQNTKVTISGEEMTALEVLKKGAEELGLEVKTKKYDFGTSVEGIGANIGGTDGYYWLFYVNGAMAQVGVDAQKVKADDKVEFKYEKSSL